MTQYMTFAAFANGPSMFCRPFSPTKARLRMIRKKKATVLVYMQPCTYHSGSDPGRSWRARSRALIISTHSMGAKVIASVT